MLDERLQHNLQLCPPKAPLSPVRVADLHALCGPSAGAKRGVRAGQGVPAVLLRQPEGMWVYGEIVYSD